VVSRLEIRKFKQAWQRFDPDGTGYISKENFPRLLGVSGFSELQVPRPVVLSTNKLPRP